MKNWLIGKDPEAGKDWRWEEKGMSKDEMVVWYHRHNGHDFEQAPGVGDDWEAWRPAVHGGHKASDTTEQLNWTDKASEDWFEKYVYSLYLFMMFVYLFLIFCV